MFYSLKRNPVFISLFLFAAFLFFFASCKKNNNGSDNNAAPAYTIADPAGDWGPPTPYGHYSRGPGYIRMSLVFDTLIWKDKDGFVPALAEKWSYIPGENAYVFSLNSKAVWHDNVQFSARDVAFTFEYIKKNPYQWVDSGIVKKTIVIDDNKVKIYLAKHYAPFLSNVAGTLPILPEHIYMNVADPWKNNDIRLATGTGPFKLGEYNRERGLYRFIAFDNYYLGKPLISELRFIKVSSEMAGNALQQKSINATQLKPDLTASFSEKGYTVIESGFDWVAKIMININQPPLDNVKIRQALMYAIDRQSIVDICLRGYGMVASPGLVPQDNAWYFNGVKEYGYDPGKAEEILREAGYIKKGSYYMSGNKILEFELLVKGNISSTPDERVAEMIQKNLERAGIKIILRSLDSKTVDTRVLHWKFQLALSGHGGMGGDPQMLERVISDKGFNSSRYHEKKMAALLKKQAYTMDKNERQIILNSIQKTFSESLPSLPLYYPSSYYVHDGHIDLFYTQGGIAIGIPIPINKLAFINTAK